MSNRSLDDFLTDQLKNAEFAAEYLNAFLEDGTPKEIADAMAAILAAHNSSQSPATLEPIVRQIQEFLQNSGLRFSAQPVAIQA